MTVTTDTRHITATAAVLDPERRLVLLIDHILEGFRQMPGGHVDPDEAPHEAAAREVEEETGVRATILDAWTPTGNPHTNPVQATCPHPLPIAVCEYPAPAKPRKNEPPHRHIDMLYLATADSTTTPVGKLDEVAGVHWLPIHDVINHRAGSTDPVLRNLRPEVPGILKLAWTRYLVQKANTPINA